MVISLPVIACREQDMAKMKKSLCIVALLILPATAGAESPEKSLANELYVKSGLEEQIRQKPRVLQAVFDELFERYNVSEQVSQIVYLKIRRLIAESYAEENFKKIIIKLIEDQMSQDEMLRGIAWLNSPLGQKCTYLEGAASTPAAMAAMQVFVKRLNKSPVAPSRLKLIEKLESANKATETAVEVVMNMQLALTTAVAASLPPTRQEQLRELQEEIEGIRSEIEAVIHQQVILGFLYTYRSLSDPELEKYIEFATSDTGVKYHYVVYAGIKKALVDGSTRFGKSVVKAFQS